MRSTSFTLIIAMLVLCIGCAPLLSRFKSILKRPAGSVEVQPAEELVDKSLYVYTNDNSKANRFSPSGWMGDSMDLKFSGSYQINPSSGTSCLRISYLARGEKGWAGVYWQNPANNWGDRKGGYDLSGAKAVTFWARGEEASVKIAEFKLGGITGRYSDSDVAWIGPVKLKKKWKKYRIPLKGKDLSYINGGFCFVVLKSDNPRGCTFYLDEIRYEW